jgi:hypothetical protein
VGTYLSSLFWITQRLRALESLYASGDNPSIFTMFSNVLKLGTAQLCSGLHQFGLPRRFGIQLSAALMASAPERV